MEYHERIKTLRKQKGLTQQQLATEIGVSRQTVMRWENGWNVPTLYYAQKLAQYFSSSVPQLMTGEEALRAKTGGDHMLAPSVFMAFLSFVPVVLYFLLNAVATAVWRALLLQDSEESYKQIIAVFDGVNGAAALFTAFLLLAYWGCRLARALRGESDGYARYTIYRHWKIGLAFLVTNGIVTAYNACVAMPHNIFNTLDWFVLGEYAAAAFLAVFIVLLFDILFKRAMKERMVSEKTDFGIKSILLSGGRRRVCSRPRRLRCLRVRFGQRLGSGVRSYGLYGCCRYRRSVLPCYPRGGMYEGA